jgi:hypothetical protein
MYKCILDAGCHTYSWYKSRLCSPLLKISLSAIAVVAPWLGWFNMFTGVLVYWYTTPLDNSAPQRLPFLQVECALVSLRNFCWLAEKSIVVCSVLGRSITCWIWGRGVFLYLRLVLFVLIGLCLLRADDLDVVIVRDVDSVRAVDRLLANRDVRFSADRISGCECANLNMKNKIQQLASCVLTFWLLTREQSAQ